MNRSEQPHTPLSPRGRGAGGEGDSPDITEVAIGIIRCGDSILVGQRGDDGPLPGCPEFPGGKRLPDETLEACVVRECREETGLEVMVLSRLQQVVHEYAHGRLCLTFFLCEPVKEAQPRSPFRWVPRAALAGLAFPEANRGVVARLVADG